MTEDAPALLSTRHRIPRQRAAPPSPGCSCAAAAATVLADLVAQPWGDVSPSIYETARLVSLAPWLDGHGHRLAFLHDSRRYDGAWGGPNGYSLVPTLSAVEALLTTLRRGQFGRTRLALLVDAGLTYLAGLLSRMGVTDLPDTPAIEIIVPAMVASVNHHLAALEAAPMPGLDRWRGARLPVPSGMDDGLLRSIRDILTNGSVMPAKLLHSLENGGPAAVGAIGVKAPPLGMVGASPAATAAWLGDPLRVPRRHRSVRYLETVARRHGGPVPSVMPITAFERAWVLNGFATARLDVAIPDELVAGLLATLGPNGTAGGPGLPPDADTTSATMHALATMGVHHPVDCLVPYETKTHFRTWVGERTSSATTNAHVLEVVMDRLHFAPASPWLVRAAGKVSTWLCDRQEADGTWRDKWHASPYYATACSCVALRRVTGRGPHDALRRAVDWALASQREDGTWGRWSGTAEETAYAIQILLLSGVPDRAAVEAAARGYVALTDAAGRPTECPPLWHDKDLYLPRTIVRAACLAAMHLVHGTPEVMARVHGA